MAELKRAGAIPVVNDPLYTADELEKIGLADYEFGEPVDAVIVQANHAEYRKVRAENVPGARTVIDGRDITSPELRAEIPTYVLGAASV